MMAADVNLQAWLDTVPNTNPSVVIPYVRSQEDVLLHYKLTVVKKGPAGSSNIGQSGNVRARADQPTALSRFSLNVGPNDKCHIELILLTNQKAAETYRYQFECPRSL